MKKEKPILSIGIIFKNEIRCLERCLSSLKPLQEALPCEIVMADTGSTDGSREVAEKYADILIDFPWIDDFAAARNAVLDRSSGRWFMTLDADEWFDPKVEEMAKFLRLNQTKYDYAGFTIRNFKSLDMESNCDYHDFYAMRIMRIATGARYVGCVHEHWTYPEGVNRQIVRLDALAYHDGYAFASKADMQAKHDRNLKLLKKKLEDNPDDLQTLTECMDATKVTDKESADYARRSLEVLHRDWETWSRYGSRVYRDAVSVAQLQKLPELLEWADKAVELYPNSIYTRIDVAYCAYARSWDNKNAGEAVRWAEMYRKGIEDYRNDNFERSELFRGLLEFASPFWERRLLIMQVEGYLELDRYEDAFLTFECINGSDLDEGQQVEACVNMLFRLHRMAVLDTEKLMERFWEQINRPEPSEDLAQKRRTAFINTAAAALTPRYREDEASREGFRRHSYTALIPLEGKCVLGDGAAILDTSDLAELEKRLGRLDLKDVPISAVSYALECGITFPMPGCPMSMEEMDALAGRLVPVGSLEDLALSAPLETGNLQTLCWKRTLVLSAIRSCKWEDEAQSMALAKSFVETERQFLPVCYASSVLTEDGLFMIPPMHRFGWYCTKAFESLDAGDKISYVRLLRAGLDTCKEMKAMVEFLIDHTPNLAPQPSDELVALTVQIRTLLAQYSPDDPVVAEIKSSPAYQQVAWLIEKPNVLAQ